jgi:hypothetical protein
MSLLLVPRRVNGPGLVLRGPSRSSRPTTNRQTFQVDLPPARSWKHEGVDYQDELLDELRCRGELPRLKTHYSQPRRGEGIEPSKPGAARPCQF